MGDWQQLVDRYLPERAIRAQRDADSARVDAAITRAQEGHTMTAPLPTVAELEAQASRMVDAAEHLAWVFGHGLEGVGVHLSCTETNALADFLRAYGHDHVADYLLDDHMDDDEPEEKEAHRG